MHEILILILKILKETKLNLEEKKKLPKQISSFLLFHQSAIMDINQ